VVALYQYPIMIVLLALAYMVFLTAHLMYLLIVEVFNV
jgi:hypothetical protein